MRGVSRRGEREAVAGRALLDEIDEQLGQRERFFPNGRDAAGALGSQHGIDAALERRQRQHRRRAADESRNAGGRFIVRREGERRGMAQPS